MFRFEHSEYLFALAAIPLMVGLYALSQRWRRRALQRFGDETLIQRMMPGYNPRRNTFKLTLLLLSLTLLILSWANPQWGNKREVVQRKGIDLIIAIDISESMLAQDLPPNRLERVKKFAVELVNELDGNNIGVILFTCSAFVQSPLTTDYNFLRLFLESAETSMASSAGTDIGSAIRMADQTFGEDNKNHKALVILSDGEDHEGASAESAKEAADNGLIVMTVGAGTPEGSYIPVATAFGTEYKRDASSNPVRTSLDEKTLREIARAANGAYFNLSSGSQAVISGLRQRIDKIDKRSFEERPFSDYNNYFQYLIALGLLLLGTEFFIAYRSKEDA
mgnify:CR=1 FL=1